MRVWPRKTFGLQVAFAALVALIVAAFLVTGRRGGLWWVAVPVSALLVLSLGLPRALARKRLLASPFPSTWRDILERRVAFYRRLDPAGRARFEDDLRIFSSEQRIFAVGPDGPSEAALDEETRVLIGASAAMLCHGLPDFEWPRVRDILVYPGSFDDDYQQGGSISGMVHLQGPIVFSKRDLAIGFARSRDGHNVGLHELAHVMDMGTGSADGLPLGMSWVATAPWIEVVADRLSKVRRKRYRRVLRDYAGINEAEFFAVAVEVFFERPERLRDADPELYGMMVEYFNQDPAAKHSGT